MKKKRASYKSFVLEFEERKRKGFPIDRTAMIEMAKRHNTPIPKNCL